jgi:hypothetical protein
MSEPAHARKTRHMRKKKVKGISHDKGKVKTVSSGVKSADTSLSNGNRTVVPHLDGESAKTPTRWISSLAKMWRSMLLGLATIIVTNIITTLQGEPVSLVNFIRQYPALSLIIGLMLVIISMVALIIPLLPDFSSSLKKPSFDRNRKNFPRWLLSTALPITSFSLFFLLLAVILIRPPWCPTAICPSPVAITSPNGVHDADLLDLYPIAVQSPSYLIPDNPARYSLNNLPKNIGAMRTDGKTLDGGGLSSPYRVVLGVHSLQRGGYGILIENVTLIVKQIIPLSYPLNAWAKESPLNYTNNPYQVTYQGENSNAALVATYLPLPGAHVQLAPGEGDSLDVQLVSQVPVDLQFTVQVAYRVVNESQLHTLMLPLVFEGVFFSSSSDWHLYQFANGHFLLQDHTT